MASYCYIQRKKYNQDYFSLPLTYQLMEDYHKTKSWASSFVNIVLKTIYIYKKKDWKGTDRSQFWQESFDVKLKEMTLLCPSQGVINIIWISN